MLSAYNQFNLGIEYNIMVTPDAVQYNEFPT